MAQWLITNFLAELGRLVDLPEPVVEFGSLQVEPEQSNDLRTVFPGKEFIGTDYRPGPGVDRVEDLRGLTFADGEVGTAICVDTLEHCEDPVTAGRELHRVVRPGGVCAISSVMWFPIHAYPGDYWRFTPEGLKTVLASFDHVWATGIGHPLLPTQVVGIASKGVDLGITDDSFSSLRKLQENWEQAPGRVRFGPIQMSPSELMRAAARDLPRATAQTAAAWWRQRTS